MIKSVLITRLSDGMVLCESNEGYLDQQLLAVKHKVKKYHAQITVFNKTDQTHLKLIEHSALGIFYKVNKFVVFTVIVDKTYPIKLAGAFIESLVEPFFDNAKTTLGASDFESRLEAISSELFFIKFDRTIKAKQREFEDPTSANNVSRMKRQLAGIHDVMRENMRLLEGRQQDLQGTEQKARLINEQSKRFQTGSKKVLWQYWLRQHLFWLVGAIAIAMIYFLVL